MRRHAPKRSRVEVEAGVTSGAFAHDDIRLTKPIHVSDLRRRMVALMRATRALERG